MDTDVLRLLEFGKLCEVLSHYAVTQAGKDAARNMQPMHDRAAVAAGIICRAESESDKVPQSNSQRGVAYVAG